MKRGFSLILVLILCMSLVPVPANAANLAHSGICGEDLVWHLDDSGTLTIAGTGPMEEFGWEGAQWVQVSKEIKKIVIEEGVTTIADWAFTAPNLGDYSNLTSVSLPSTLISIGSGAFVGCTGLKSIALPDGLQTIGDSAFRETGLTSVHIPAGVTHMQSHMFGSCPNLKKITVDPDNPSYEADSNGALYNKNKYVLILVPGGYSGNFTVPDSVLTIGSQAFNGPGLTSVTIPASVLDIGYQPFGYSCTGLKKVIVAEDSPYFCNDSYGVLFTKDMKELIQAPSSLTGNYAIPKGVETIGYSSFVLCTKLTGVTIPEGVTTVGMYAFNYLGNLTSINIPDTVTTLETQAFCGTGISSVTIPGSVQNIDQFAFGDCEKLTDVTICEDVPLIGDYMFANCFCLRQVTIPGSVKSIGDGAFRYLWNPALVFTGNAPAISDYAFEGSQLACYYRKQDTTWAEAVQSNYGAESVKWVPYVGATPVVIIGQPVSVVTTVGTTAEFNVNATGTNLSYQWQYKTSFDGKWLNCTAAGNQTATVKVPVTAGKNGYMYRCVVTDGVGNYVESNVAWLYIYGIVQQPTTQKVKAGTKATFSVEATGENLTYQWQFKKTADGGWSNCTATGAKTATMQVDATTSKSGYYYRCVIEDISGVQMTSDVVRLYVLGIKTQPTTQKVKAGTTATFTVSATGSNKTYQWQYKTSADGTWKSCTAEGNKTATLKVAATTGKSSYYYRCQIKDNGGNTIYTNAVRLYVLGIKTQPTTQKVKAGTTATFKVSATGLNKTYQWQYKTSADGEWKNCTATGNKTATLKVSATTGKSGYYYRCVIKDDGGNSVTTNAVRLYVLGITTQPAAKTAKAGTTVKFTVAATGAGKTYQWQYRTSSTGTWKNTTATGAKTATLKITATAAKNGYQYRCIVKDSAGNSVTSNAAKLTVK